MWVFYPVQENENPSDPISEAPGNAPKLNTTCRRAHAKNTLAKPPLKSASHASIAFSSLMLQHACFNNALFFSPGMFSDIRLLLDHQPYLFRPPSTASAHRSTVSHTRSSPFRLPLLPTSRSFRASHINAAHLPYSLPKPIFLPRAGMFNDLSYAPAASAWTSLLEPHSMVSHGIWQLWT